MKIKLVFLHGIYIILNYMLFIELDDPALRRGEADGVIDVTQELDKTTLAEGNSSSTAEPQKEYLIL